MTAPLATDGPAAPPRANGELVFNAPWEGRAFGMVVSLYEAGAFEWSTFQAALIARIGAWERANSNAGNRDPGAWSYYEQWLGALEDVLAADGTIDGHEVEHRAELLAGRPAGHDHGDHHHGDHDHGDHHQRHRDHGDRRDAQ
jgi:nitrile hydratase accessory protein